MDKVLKQAGGSPATLTVAPASTPDRVPGLTSGPEATRFDAHWWHDPRNVETAVGAIRAALGKADPQHAKTYAANASRYVGRVRALDAGIARCFAAVPAAQRKLVTDHDAFNYFAKRYGITVVGAVIPSQTTQAQASAGEISKLASVIRSQHVRAVFPESSINPKLADALARETGARSDYTLYGDTLGAAGSAGATYLSMEQHNADAMVRGFTGGARGCTIAGI
jgi:ABC-type Zn uptake system ZnuABC Zn-binding protein ZnuA